MCFAVDLILLPLVGVGLALFLASISYWQRITTRKAFKISLEKGKLHEKEPDQQPLNTLFFQTNAHHPVVIAFTQLIEKDGAGTWPPSSNFDNWQKVIQPYQEIYVDVALVMTLKKPLLDDKAIRVHRRTVRSLLCRLLNERIHMDKVIHLMRRIEVEDDSCIRRDQVNALYCTISYLRHVYRWAINPIVRIAQLEIEIQIPVELELPWQYLQRHFGCTAQSGNHTSNVLHSFDYTGRRRLQINMNMPQSIMDTERQFFSLFYNWEIKSYALYCEIVCAIIAFEDDHDADKMRCAHHLQNLIALLPQLFAIFHSNLIDAKVSKDVWMSYTQGVHGWGAGNIIDGTLVIYNGVSGSHILAFHVLDAFLGIPSYLPKEEMQRYVPTRQREFSAAIRSHCFRDQIDNLKSPHLCKSTERLVQQFKIFRIGHRKRVMPYLKQPAQERRHMTTGKSIDGDGDIDAALAPLEDLLLARIRQTK